MQVSDHNTYYNNYLYLHKYSNIFPSTHSPVSTCVLLSVDMSTCSDPCRADELEGHSTGKLVRSLQRTFTYSGNMSSNSSLSSWRWWRILWYHDWNILNDNKGHSLNNCARLLYNVHKHYTPQRSADYHENYSYQVHFCMLYCSTCNQTEICKVGKTNSPNIHWLCSKTMITQICCYRHLQEFTML